MFKRKLTALDYHLASEFDSSDEQDFRNLIVWIEDQKIRHYKIEERLDLRNITHSDWPKYFQQYLEDLDCAVRSCDRPVIIDWLLGLAVRLEYGDKVDVYKPITATSFKESQGSTPQLQSSNPLDSLDFHSDEFKAGVLSLAQMLGIPKHCDHLVVLEAVSKVVRERLSKEVIEKGPKTGQGKLIPLDQLESGLESSGDYVMNEAAKILRLLHIRELRKLQTDINQAIVAVQTLTANPKTDQRLGKVGR